MSYSRAFGGDILVGTLLGTLHLLSPEPATLVVSPSQPHRVRVAVEGRRPAALAAAARAAVPVAEPTAARTMSAPVATTTAAAAPALSSAAATSAGPAKRASTYWSVGKLKALPHAMDIDGPGVIGQVARTRSYKGEVILFTADAGMAGWGYHWVYQLRRMGYEHWVMLADVQKTCESIHEQWEPMERVHNELPLSCVWSSAPRAHAGWKQWRPRGVEDKMHSVYILWCTRWWVARLLLGERLNVLSLDIDAVMLTDVYELLRAPPLVEHDVLITRNSDNSQART